MIASLLGPELEWAVWVQGTCRGSVWARNRAQALARGQARYLSVDEWLLEVDVEVRLR